MGLCVALLCVALRGAVSVPLEFPQVRASSEHAGVGLRRGDAVPDTPPSVAPGIFERKVLRTHFDTLWEVMCRGFAR